MCSLSAANPFIPYPATVTGVLDLTPDIKLFTVELTDPEQRENFDYRPGQFAFVSAYGVGEGPYGIASLAERKTGLEFAVRRVGTVTRALHELEPGATLGIRGPYGNWFPMEDYRGKNILIIGGGIGMAPLRPVIHYVLDHRSDYSGLTIVNGARSPRELVFSDEYDLWAEPAQCKLELCVDRGDDEWQGRVALVPQVVSELRPSPDNTVAIICGPPIMIRFVLAGLKELGFSPAQIVTTLEQKMKCGIGKCARCNVGDKYVCKDGPVFTFEQILNFIEQF
ncbi:MAG: FAD/NAD(P)-binding protein [Dehalococcoidia bacterium]|jgi:NAD(P)H-flavin reductase